jgi:predicted ATPase
VRTLRLLRVQGFKSFEDVHVELGDLNVVIGPNGAGKSNLIGVFRLLERVLSGNLQAYVASDPDRLLFHGRKRTPAMSIDLHFDQNSYGFQLRADKDTLIFDEERVEYSGAWKYGEPIARGHRESKLEEAAEAYKNQIPKHVFPIVRDLVVYHFHDTSDSSPAKQTVDIDDNRALRPDGSNIAAYLYRLQQTEPAAFRRIEEHVRLVAPFFDQFVLEPLELNKRKIKLEWKQVGSDAYFDAYSLSDGTLRFICLATVLMQPSPPALVLLDEPELGLHPFAIEIVAGMIEAATAKSQVLLATQSVTLLDHFAAKDVIVAENDGHRSHLRRLDEAKLKDWLGEYSLGELWEKNVLGGRP